MSKQEKRWWKFGPGWYPVALAFFLLGAGVYVNVRHGAAHGNALNLMPGESGAIAALPTIITAAAVHLLVLLFEKVRYVRMFHAWVASIGVLCIAAASFRLSFDAWEAVSRAAGIRPELAKFMPWITEAFLGLTVYMAWLVRQAREIAEEWKEPVLPTPDTAEELFKGWATEPPQAEPMPEPVIPEPEVTGPTAERFPEPEFSSPALRGAGHFMAMADRAKNPAARAHLLSMAERHGKAGI